MTSYKFKNVFLDLDGTLVDSRKGIISCMQYALGQLKLPVPQAQELNWMIGPPIQESFARVHPKDQQHRIDEGIALYREEYGRTGMFASEPYEGILEVLTAVRDRGQTCFVVTSKPLFFAKPIVNNVGMSSFFKEIYGSELSGVRGNKGELIHHVLTQEKLNAKDCVMIGDREHDIFGAKKNEVSSIGVLWGCGDRQELESAGANALASSPQELLSLV